MVETVGAGDDRELPQTYAEPVSVLQAEDLVLAAGAHGLVIGPDGGDIRAGDAWFHRLDARKLVLQAALVDVQLLLVGLAAAETAVDAGVIAVEHADDVHEDHVPGLNQAIRTQMGMGMGSIAGRDLHVVDPLGPQTMHLVGRHRLQIVLLDPGRNRLRDPVERAIDDRRTVFQAHDLVFVLDGPRVLHDALAIGDVVAVLQAAPE